MKRSTTRTDRSAAFERMHATALARQVRSETKTGEAARARRLAQGLGIAATNVRADVASVSKAPHP